MRDLPFVDSIAPIIFALAAWTGINIITIAPDLIAPRLTNNVWMPACKQGVQNANAQIVNNRQQEINLFLAARRAKQQQVQLLLNPFLQIMGEEFSRTLGKTINDSMNLVSDLETKQALQDHFGHLAPKPTVNVGYCSCVISELLQDRISTGLYTASLRMWIPTNIQQLNKLSTTLISSKQCSN